MISSYDPHAQLDCIFDDNNSQFDYIFLVEHTSGNYFKFTLSDFTTKNYIVSKFAKFVPVKARIYYLADVTDSYLLTNFSLTRNDLRLANPVFRSFLHKKLNEKKLYWENYMFSTPDQLIQRFKRAKESL